MTLALCVLCTLALAALAHRADAVVFGADLEQRPPNNPLGCEVAGVLEFPPGSGSLLLTGSPFPSSCTWTAHGRAPDFAETLTTPVSGTVRQVQVRVGTVTGPMQVVVYSSLAVYDPNDSTRPPAVACCQVRALSQVFTPTPNAITTVDVNLPVVAQLTPPPGTNIAQNDSLGLSVLAAGVPVPAHHTGVYDALAGAPIGGIYTRALGPGEERTAPAGLAGFQLLLRADVTPTGAGPGVGGAGQEGAGSAGNSGSSTVKGTCAGRPATIAGTDRRDVIRGTPRRDVIAAGAGNDVISGLGGNDLICAGAGDDRVLGGAGDDRLFGQAGRDTLLGGAGRDRLLGGAAADTLDGQAGAGDVLIGGPGADVCRRGTARGCPLR